MAITTKPLYIGHGLELDRETRGLFQSIIDRIEKPRVASINDLNQTISGPSVAEVQAISDKVDELLAALRTATILES